MYIIIKILCQKYVRNICMHFHPCKSQDHPDSDILHDSTKLMMCYSFQTITKKQLLLYFKLRIVLLLVVFLLLLYSCYKIKFFIILSTQKSHFSN